MSGSTGGPPKKKQKTDRLVNMDGPTIGLSTLTKHIIKFDYDLSPGALHANRVAVHAPSSDAGNSSITAFFASDRDVYSLAIPASSRGLIGERGKGGVYLPRPADEVSPNHLPELSLRAEIQSLTLSSPTSDGTVILAASDSYGKATLARLHFPPLEASDTESQQPVIMGVEQLQPADVLVEGGWTGVAIAPGQPSQTAIARHFAKDITLFDGPMAVRTINTMYRPNAVQLLSSDVAPTPGSGPLVAAAEGPVVSIWDVRASGRGARIARLCSNPHSGHFFSLAVSSGTAPSVIGAAGVDRSVLVWDPRTWRVLDRWNNCLKYEATSLHFLSSNPSYCVACSLDYEVVCGKWAGDKRNRLGGGHRTRASSEAGSDAGAGGGVENGGADGAAPAGGLSFRGDAKWMGLTKAHGRDIFAGLTATKQIYIAELSAGAM